MAPSSVQQNPRAVDIGRVNLGVAGERQCGYAMDHDVGIDHYPLDRFGVTNVAEDRVDAVSLKVVELSDV